MTRILAVRIVVAVLIGAVLAAAFWSLFEIPCPNCGKRLGSVAFWVSVGRVRRYRSIVHTVVSGLMWICPIA